MSVYQYASPGAFGYRALAAGRFVLRTLAAPFAVLARESRIRRTVGQLANLDDRTLTDIGLRRSQIVSTAIQVVDWPQIDPRRHAR